MGLLSRFKGLIKKVAAPAIGFLTGGPLGAVAGAAASFTSAPVQAAAPPPSFAQTPLQMAMAGPTQTASLGGIATRGASMVTGAIRGAIGLIRSSTGRISGVRLGSGQFVSRKKAVALAKRVGIEAAALGLGITVLEMAEMVATAPTRRARGISASDIRRTKSTLRKVCTISKQFADVKTARKACR